MVRRSPPADGVLDSRPGWGLRTGAPEPEGVASLIAALPDGVALLDRDIIACANAELARLLGATTPVDLVGRPATREDGLQATPSFAGWQEERWLRVDGLAIRLEVSRKDVVIADQPRQLVIARDATASAQLQAQLVQADRLAAIGSLAAGVAHQINNPLSYVIADLAFLSEEIPEIQRVVARGAGPAELRARIHEAAHALLEARAGVERVAALVRDLKMLSRIDDDRREPVDLCELLDSACNVASHELGLAKVVRSYGPVPQVVGNESRLGHVFVNLVLNAAQAMREAGDGPHELAIKTLTDEQGRAVVLFEDTGTGIPPKALQRIFDPFFTTKPIGIGVGLGLTTALCIVAAMGGSLDASNQVPRGATFRVALPVHQGPRAPAPPPSVTPAPVVTRRPRVLIVDDEPTLMVALRRALARDAEVEIRASGAEAVDLLMTDHRFDVVLCDIMMPEMTGIDVYERVQAQDPALASRFVFMTGGAFTASTREFLDQVPNPRLEKPFDLGNLRQLIRERAAAAERR